MIGTPPSLEGVHLSFCMEKVGIAQQEESVLYYEKKKLQKTSSVKFCHNHRIRLYVYFFYFFNYSQLDKSSFNFFKVQTSGGKELSYFSILEHKNLLFLFYVFKGVFQPPPTRPSARPHKILKCSSINKPLSFSVVSSRYCYDIKISPRGENFIQ